MLIPQRCVDLRVNQDGFVITQISVKCQKGHLQPSEFEDDAF